MKISTHKEAIELQTKLENIVKDVLKEDKIEFSMALTGRLKVSIDSNYICFNRDFNTVDYIRYTGDYNELNEQIEQLLEVFAIYQSDFDSLIDSYDDISKLI